MNIFSNTDYQINLVENDSDQKEKARRQKNRVLEIRRKKRQVILKKNRIHDDSPTNVPTDRISTGNASLCQQQALSSMEPATREEVGKIYQIEFKFEQIDNLVKDLKSQDVCQQHHGCIGLRKLLCTKDNHPIKILIKGKCIRRFIQLITQTNYPVLQLEAAWCLTNIIASGTTRQTNYIINKGLISLFCGLLTSRFSDISEQAIWAIGNIAGDCSVYRDMILKCNGLKPLVNILLNTQDQQIIKHASWALSNLCRGRPPPQFELVKEAIPPLCKVFQMETDPEVLTDVSWAICYLSEGNEDRIQQVIDTGIIPSLIKHIDHQELSVQYPCLRTIGFICTGSDSQTDAIIANGALPELFKLIKYQKISVRSEACWVLSNIAAGNAQQASLIINENSQIESLFKCILSDSVEVSREAAWVISNCTSQGNPQELLRLVDLNVLEVFSHILKTSQDSKTLAQILESLKHILKCGNEEYKKGSINPFAAQLKSLGATETIENLQKHSDKDIYKRSLFLIDNFF